MPAENYNLEFSKISLKPESDEGILTDLVQPAFFHLAELQSENIRSSNHNTIKNKHPNRWTGTLTVYFRG